MTNTGEFWDGEPMDLAEPTKSSGIWPALIAVAVVIVVAAGIGVVYFQRPHGVATTTQRPVTAKTTPTSTDPVLTSAATVTTTISDLDAQITQMDQDLKSTDDTSPTL